MIGLGVGALGGRRALDDDEDAESLDVNSGNGPGEIEESWLAGWCLRALPA